MPIRQTERVRNREQDDLSRVGPRLRAVRQKRDLTLTVVAEATGISVSTLSRLESGGRKPTIELLLPLARLYGQSLDALIGTPPTGDPRVHLQPVTRHGMVMVPLTRRPGGIQAYKLVIPATERREPDDLRTHDGYEWLYVLEGRLRLRLADEDVVLESGEAAEFDTHVPHWFGTADSRPVEVLSLFGKQGERAHLRATASRRSDAGDPRAAAPAGTPSARSD